MSESVKKTPKTVSGRNRASATTDMIVRYLERQVQTGIWPPGTRLPSIRKLAQDFECSTTPVLEALRQVQSEGWLEQSASARFFVAVRLQPKKDRVSNKIHLLCSASEKPHHQYSHLSRGLDQAMFDRVLNYPGLETQFSVLSARPGFPEFSKTIQRCRQSRPGVVLLGSIVLNDLRKVREVRSLAAEGIPVAYPRFYLECKGCHAVTADYAGGQEQLTRHLLRQGHENILRFRLPGPIEFEHQKTRGFEQAMSTIGILPEACRERTLELNGSLLEAEEDPKARLPLLAQVERVMKRYPETTAIMAINDTHVALLRNAFHTLGIPAPVFTGYDAFWEEQRDRLQKLFTLPMDLMDAPASVDRNLPRVGFELVDLASELLNDPENLVPRTRIIPQTLVKPEAT